MRTLFLILLLANLIVFAAQFDVVRSLVYASDRIAQPPQLNPERLRIIRDTSPRSRGPALAPLE